jgi:hypothetical protein
MSFEEVVEFFTNIQRALKRRVLELADIPPMEWDEMHSDDQEAVVMGLMHQMFTPDDAYVPALIAAIDEYYNDHVDMAKEILLDLYDNLIQWLESEVNIGAGASEKKKMEKMWVDAFKQCELFDFDDHRGQGWAKKKEVMEVFGKLANFNSHASVNNKFNMYAGEIFKDTREGVRIYIKIRDDYVIPKGVKK